MNAVVLECPNCGFKNRPGAEWCGRCLVSFKRPVHESAEPGLDPREAATAPDPRGSRLRGQRWIAAILALLALWTTVRALGVISDRQRFSGVSISGATDPNGFRFKDIDPATGEPVRFDPCTPVGYVVNTAHAPPGSLADIHSAIDQTSEATGSELVYEGPTNEAPRVNRPLLQPGRYGRRWPPLLIAWSTEDPSLFREHGVGVAANVFVANGTGRLVYVSGIIVMNATQQLSTGFGAGRTWGKVILHEMGHIVGLAHVEDAAEVMNPSVVSSPASWGSGDLAGLRRLGSLAGCVAIPALPR